MTQWRISVLINLVYSEFDLTSRALQIQSWCGCRLSYSALNHKRLCNKAFEVPNRRDLPQAGVHAVSWRVGTKMDCTRPGSPAAGLRGLQSLSFPRAAATRSYHELSKSPSWEGSRLRAEGEGCILPTCACFFCFALFVAMGAGRRTGGPPCGRRRCAVQPPLSSVCAAVPPGQVLLGTNCLEYCFPCCKPFQAGEASGQLPDFFGAHW